MATIEYAPGAESVTATFTSPVLTGERFGEPLGIGIYKGNGEEIWLCIEGEQFNVQVGDVPELCKQLKRAVRLAREQDGLQP